MSPFQFRQTAKETSGAADLNGFTARNRCAELRDSRIYRRSVMVRPMKGMTTDCYRRRLAPRIGDVPCGFSALRSSHSPRLDCFGGPNRCPCRRRILSCRATPMPPRTPRCRRRTGNALRAAIREHARITWKNLADARDYGIGCSTALRSRATAAASRASKPKARRSTLGSRATAAAAGAAPVRRSMRTAAELVASLADRQRAACGRIAAQTACAAHTNWPNCARTAAAAFCTLMGRAAFRPKDSTPRRR